MNKAELKFHIGGVLVCPTNYVKGDLKGTMNFGQTVKDIMHFVDLYINSQYTRRKHRYGKKADV